MVAAAAIPDAKYQRVKDSARERNARIARAGRDIGELPAVARPAERAKVERDFRAFCEIYLPHSFPLAWSRDHLTVIGRIEAAVLSGGLFAYAMPRGSGKTTLCEAAALWAALHGHRQFVAMIGATAKAATSLLESVRIELETNEILQGDFPEVCWPIICLEGIPQRRLLHRGELVRMEFKADRIVLPSIPGSRAAGAILAVAGITGRIRGWKHKRADGASARPSLVIVDDPQTDESAKSPGQCESRERILAGAVLGLAGPGKKIAGVMPCTVIRRGDVADNLLDRKKHPEWSGERTKTLYSFPTNEKLWDEYAELRRNNLAGGGDGAEATEFYGSNREAMDAGASVAWPVRFEPGELSAIQSAMNLKLRDERAFMAEAQNDPMPDTPEDADELTAEQILERVNRLPRFQPPAAAVQLTAMIDVQGSALFYVAAAWENGFTGSVIDYGCWPDQGRPYFTLREAKQTLAIATGAEGLEQCIYAGLERLTQQILGREYLAAGGSALRIGKCLVDANWGDSTAVVYRFCRQSAHAAVLLPSHGKGIGASGLPMHEYQQRPGEEKGLNWRIRPSHERGGRNIMYDTNAWKSFLRSRLATGMGGRGALTLFGDRPGRHRMLADHLTSERKDRVTSETRGRTVEQWSLVAPGRDNHWLDCLVGCCVGASVQKVALDAHGAEQPRKRVSFSEQQRQAKERRKSG